MPSNVLCPCSGIMAGSTFDGIIQLTTNHPARVAERIATLDLVSDGRVELGLGEGASVTELHPFNLRFRDKRDVWEDAVKCTLPMFWNHGWEYEGEFFKFPLRAGDPINSLPVRSCPAGVCFHAW